MISSVLPHRGKHLVLCDVHHISVWIKILLGFLINHQLFTRQTVLSKKTTLVRFGLNQLMIHLSDTEEVASCKAYNTWKDLQKGQSSTLETGLCLIQNINVGLYVNITCIS